MYSQGTSQARNLQSSIKVALTAPYGETLANAEVSVVNTASNGMVKLTMPTIPGFTPSGWRIYRGTASGAETLLTTIPGIETIFYDDGVITPGVTVPPSASYGNIGQLPSTISSATTTSLVSSFVDLSFQQYNTTSNIAYDLVPSQAFVAHKSIITSISLPLDNLSTATGNVVVSIFANTLQTTTNIPYTASGNAPIATVSLPVGQVLNFATNGLYTTFNFASPVILVPGTVYHIVANLDTSTDTNTSGKVLKWHGYSGSTSLTTLFGNWLTGSNTVFTTGSWSAGGTSYSGLGYQINVGGQLSPSTYYYVVSAVTGFVYKSSVSFANSGTGSAITNNQFDISYCAGDGTSSFYNYIAYNGNTNNSIVLGLMESYSNQTTLINNYNLAAYTNGTAVLGQTYSYNIRSTTLTMNTNSLANTVNTTYRLHSFLDHFALDVAGDSANTGFAEGIAFTGLITPKGSSDKPYVLTGTNLGWLQLRDYNNAVNTLIYPMFLSNAVNATAKTDSFAYLNKYNNQYDGLVMYLADSNGIRGSVPDMLVFPSGITAVLNNHDTFIVNGITYEFYMTTNNSQYPYSYYASGAAFYNLFYPAFNMNQ